MFLETRKSVPTERAGTPHGGDLELPACFAKWNLWFFRSFSTQIRTKNASVIGDPTAE
jgi:hypothetical protein